MQVTCFSNTVSSEEERSVELPLYAYGEAVSLNSGMRTCCYCMLSGLSGTGSYSVTVELAIK